MPMSVVCTHLLSVRVSARVSCVARDVREVLPAVWLKLRLVETTSDTEADLWPWGVGKPLLEQYSLFLMAQDLRKTTT